MHAVLCRPYPEEIDRSASLVARAPGIMAAALCLLVGLLVLQACQNPEPLDSIPAIDSTDTRSKDLATLAQETASLTLFLQVLERTDMTHLLREAGPITVFAPTDAAFARAPFALDTLLSPARHDSLRKVLSLHIVRGRFMPSRLTDSMVVSTLLNEPLVLESAQEGNVFTVNGQEVLSTLEGHNGVLHVIGTLLQLSPPDTAQAPAEPLTVQ